MPYRQTIRGSAYLFDDLKALMAKATPARSGDTLAGVAAGSEHERVIARMTLAEVPLAHRYLSDLASCSHRAPLLYC